MNTSHVILSLGLSVLAGGLSYWRGSLDRGGWAGAVVVGTLTAGFGGWDWGILVIVFFVSSSMLSRLGAHRKARFVVGQWEKSDRRDAGQVLANGGLVSVLALLWWLWPAQSLWAAAIGVLATVTGDTWATEVGVLSRHAPRLITTGRPVAPGASGGVTLLGSTAALGGAACIAASALLLGLLLQQEFRPWVLPAGLFGGVVGVACDSLLGATVQAMRWCPRCQRETERRRHTCGSATVPLRGRPWLTNDAVNALASLAGGVTALVVA